MKLRLIRSYFTELSTVGELYANDTFICYTLEDRIREVKIPNETAIPAGVYPVEITWSNKFGQLMPLVSNVPNFSGIRIHWGNTAADTSGCLLLGLERQENRILRSREAYGMFYNILANAGGKATLTIENSINKPKAAAASLALAVGITATSIWAFNRLGFTL